MNRLVVILLLLFVAACQPADKKTYDVPADFDGNYYRYYDNGKLRIKAPLLDKRKHGLALEYYVTGELRAEINYHLDTLHGERIWFFKNGIAYKKTPFVKGVKHGVQEFFYEHGGKKAEIHWVNGNVAYGLTREFRSNGQPKTPVELVFKEVNQLNMGGKYMLYLHTSKKVKDPQFKEGKLNSEGFLIESASALIPTNDGGAHYDISSIYKGIAMEQKDFVVIYTTSFGNLAAASAHFNIGIAL